MLIRRRLPCISYVRLLCRYRVSVSEWRPMTVRKRRPMTISKRISCIIRLSCVSNIRLSICKWLTCVIRLSCVRRIPISKWILKRKRLLCIRRISCTICKWCLECERLLSIRRISCTICKWLLRCRRRLNITRGLTVTDIGLLSTSYRHFKSFLLNFILLFICIISLWLIVVWITTTTVCKVVCEWRPMLICAR